jgi:hypothetical protein
VFDDTKNFLDQYNDRRSLELDNQEVGGWSTTNFGSYSDMLQTFDTTTENTQAQQLYDRTKRQTTPSPLAHQAGYRMMIHFQANLRRATRRKFAVTKGAEQRSNVDLDRFAHQEGKICKTVIGRLHDWIKKRAG